MSTITVLLHGAGSCPQTALRLLEPVVAAGSQVVAPRVPGDVEAALDLVSALVEEHRLGGSELVRLAGISLGAHVAALWVARGGRVPELVLAMPAWTGAPDEVAALTCAAADDLDAHGTAGVLARLSADPATSGDWVLDELTRGWSSYADGELTRELRAAGASHAPTCSQLGRIAVPTAVVALADDPVHPEAVATTWVASMPGARLAVVPRHAPARDRAALGRAASRTLERLSGSR